jgi:hypothetical protein
MWKKSRGLNIFRRHCMLWRNCDVLVFGNLFPAVYLEASLSLVVQAPSSVIGNSRDLLMKCLSFNERRLFSMHFFHLRNTALNIIVRCKIARLRRPRQVSIYYRFLELLILDIFRDYYLQVY